MRLTSPGGRHGPGAGPGGQRGRLRRRPPAAAVRGRGRHGRPPRRRGRERDGARGAARRPSRRAPGIGDAITNANAAVHDKATGDAELQGMGTTLTAVVPDGNGVLVGHVGDSRAYLLRDGELRQLTTDHSLVEELVREGRLTEEQAAVHPQRSIITRALGVEANVEVDVYPVPLLPGDRLLLCSDGLTTMLRPEAIAGAAAPRDATRPAPRTCSSTRRTRPAARTTSRRSSSTSRTTAPIRSRPAPVSVGAAVTVAEPLAASAPRRGAADPDATARTPSHPAPRRTAAGPAAPRRPRPARRSTERRAAAARRRDGGRGTSPARRAPSDARSRTATRSGRSAASPASCCRSS